MANFYVSKTGNDANDGSSWSLAKLTIQNALNLATTSDTVWVRSGTYLENITINSGVTLRSETGLAADVVIDGNNIARTITMTNNTLSLIHI